MSPERLSGLRVTVAGGGVGGPVAALLLAFVSEGLAPADLRVRSVMQEDPGRVYETVLDLCRR
jgi:hypothetical protein